MDPYLINTDVGNLEILHVRGNGKPSQYKQINLGFKFRSKCVNFLLQCNHFLCFLCSNIYEELSNSFISLDASHQGPSHEEVYQVKGIYSSSSNFPNIIVVYQLTIGIPMGTKCVP